MTDQPTEHTPPVNDEGHNDTPPVNDEGQGKDMAPLPKYPPPPSENHPHASGPGNTPPHFQEHAPVQDVGPDDQDSPPPTISGELRADLCRVWSLGFLDAMKGEDVNDDDAIPSALAEPLSTLAEGCVESASSLISQVFVENPETVFQVVYSAGHDVYLALIHRRTPMDGVRKAEGG